jgi:hypothetical protein
MSNPPVNYLGLLISPGFSKNCCIEWKELHVEEPDGNTISIL